jgi:hypothetical protein
MNWGSIFDRSFKWLAAYIFRYVCARIQLMFFGMFVPGSAGSG